MVKEPIVISMTKTNQQTKDVLRDTQTLLNIAVMKWRVWMSSRKSSLVDLASAHFETESRTVDVGAVQAARIHSLAEILTAADLIARIQAERIVDGETARQRREFAEILDMTPAAAIDWLDQIPGITKEQWEQTLAGKMKPAFFVAHIENETIRELIRQEIEESMRRGYTLKRFEQNIRERLTGLEITGGHLRTVWHMNVTNSLQAAREEELSSPGVKTILGYYLFDAVIDGVVRPNHRVLDKGIAPTDWEGWMRYKPMLGYNCRCNRIAITESRARRMIASGEGFDLTERIPAGAGPDQGFIRMI